jgi:uncharacterized protein (DUF433 family)
MKNSSYGLVKIDFREPRRELAVALRCLRQICSLVAKDPDIQGGDPVFKGTRVPVHLIANMLSEGASEAEIREAYPRLTSAMIRLAPLYATAYPLRGRPRKTVMLDIAPSRTIRRPLSPRAAAIGADGFNRISADRRPGAPLSDTFFGVTRQHSGDGGECALLPVFELPILL